MPNQLEGDQLDERLSVSLWLPGLTEWAINCLSLCLTERWKRTGPLSGYVIGTLTKWMADSLSACLSV